MFLENKNKKIAQGMGSTRSVRLATRYEKARQDVGLFLSSSHFAGKCSTDLEEEVVRVAVSIGHPLNDFDPVVHALQHAGVQPVEGTGNDTLHIWLQLLGKSYQSINSATEGHAGPFPPGASGRRLAFRKP